MINPDILAAWRLEVELEDPTTTDWRFSPNVILPLDDCLCMLTFCVYMKVFFSLTFLALILSLKELDLFLLETRVSD